jgi:mRNA interferase MazF
LEAKRGEVWLVNLNPAKGREQADMRPAVIISVDNFNNSHADLVVVLPVTTKAKGIPLHVRVVPPEGGIKHISFIKCEDIRSISKERLVECWGTIENGTLEEIEKRLLLLLGLK